MELPHRGVAGVVDDEIEDAVAVRLGAIEQRGHVLLSRRVHRDPRRAAAGVANRGDQRVDLLRGPSRHEDVQAFPCEPLAQGSAEPGPGSHADDDGFRLHGHLLLIS